MLKYISVFLVTFGSLIMLYNIISFYRTLLQLKKQMNEKKIFSHWVYAVCILLMLLFFMGYIAFDMFLILNRTTSNLQDEFLLADVLFFEAVFFFIMILVLKNVSASLSKKSSEITKTLIKAIEAKDQYTRGHSVHVADVTKLIYEYLPKKLKKKINFGRLIDTAILHDIGKIGINDNVLNKPDMLTQEERHIIEQHPSIGKKILENTSYELTGEILYCHHERIDGKGYYGMAEEQIPFEAKIIAVADTYSALATDRIYRPKKSYDEAIKIIKEVSGTQLDSELVDIFVSIPKDKLERIILDF